MDVLRSVLTKYNDVNIQTDQGESQFDIFKPPSKPHYNTLNQKNSIVNVRFLGITPLILVAREGHILCVHFLLRFGVKVSLCDNVNLMTAVHYSAKNGHSQCLTWLLHNSEDQNVVNMVDR